MDGHNIFAAKEQAVSDFLAAMKGGEGLYSSHVRYGAKQQAASFLRELKGKQSFWDYITLFSQHKTYDDAAERKVKNKQSVGHGVVAAMCRKLEAKIHDTHPTGYWMARQLDQNKPAAKPAIH